MHESERELKHDAHSDPLTGEQAVAFVIALLILVLLIIYFKFVHATETAGI